MMIPYSDTATFVKVSSDGYGNNKVVTQQVDLNCTFVQNTQFSRGGNVEEINADAICWVDPDEAFAQENYNRFEGMYILEPLYGAGDNASWYKVTDCTVNRDHLLSNQIDNIELRLKKTRPIPGVS